MRIRFAGIAAILAMFTAACGGDGNSPEPSVSTPPTTAPATPPPSTPRTGPLTTGPGVLSGEKPPVLPDAAKQHNSAGAVAFASYYFKAYDWGIATTDPYLVQQVSAPSCTACRRYANELNALRRNGGHVEHGRTDLLSIELVSGTFKTESEYVAKCKIKEDAVVLITPSAPPSTSAPASNSISLVFVSWSDRGWRIVEEGAP